MEEKWYPLKDWPGYEISEEGHVRSYLDRRGFGKNKYVEIPELLEEQTHRDGYYEDDRYFHTMAEAADYFGVSKSCITLCCQGKSHNVRGKHVCYAEDVDFLRRNIDNIRGLDGQKKRVKAINLETGEERIYSSRRQASRDLGIPESYISNIIAGRSHKTRGWTFEDMPIFLEKR